MSMWHESCRRTVSIVGACARVVPVDVRPIGALNETDEPTSESMLKSDEGLIYVNESRRRAAPEGCPGGVGTLGVSLFW